MARSRLEWLDTHLVHHRWEWHPLNVVRPLLHRLICDRYERFLLGPADWEADRLRLAREQARTGQTKRWREAMPEIEAADDFYEDDEPIADVIAAWNASEKHLTAPPAVD